MSTFTGQSFSSSRETEWKKFFQSYLASVSIGALNGVVVDEIAKYLLEKIAKPYIETKKEIYDCVYFLISLPIKIATLSNIKRDMVKYNIPHKGSLMFLTTSLTPFRGFLKNGYLNLFESDFCKQLLVFLKSRLSIFYILS